MKTTPLLTQFRPTYFSVDCGMAYLIRLESGKFIIIDSTFGEYDEPHRLYSLMCLQNVTDSLPCVAAWFFTHPHGDHTGGFIGMSRTHKDKIKVEKVIYSFPADMCEKTHDHKAFLEAIQLFGAETVTPHRGDVLRYDGAEFKVLFTEEDNHIRPLNVNETSLTMKMTLGNYTVMWLGDLQNVGSRIVMELYKPEELKCDLLQVGHHGYWGGSDALYRAVDPEIALWPMPEFRYLDMLSEPCNSFFSDPENHIRHIFIGGIEENTFDMTAPIEVTVPYEPKRIVADFSKKSVSALGWASVTGGYMGYTACDIAFGKENCTLTTKSSRTLLQMIPRGQVAVSDKYRFDLTLMPEKTCETLALIYDCPTVTTPDSFVPYPLNHMAGETLKITLEVDRKANAAIICVNGRSETLPLRTNAPCDVVLLLKDAKVEISETVFENL